MPDPNLFDARYPLVDVLDRQPCRLGEGPMWDDRTREVFWVDILACMVHRLDLETARRTTLPMPTLVSAIVPRLATRSGWLVSLKDGPAFVDGEGAITPLAPCLETDGSMPKAQVRCNDAKCDAWGRYWLGTMGLDETLAAGSLYRLDTGFSKPLRIVEDVAISNGLGWSPDQKRMYFIDSGTNRIDTFDYDAESGEIANRRPLVRIPPEVGTPDGMAIDADGCLWVVLHDGGQVQRYTPDGRLDRAIGLPVVRVTSCAFVGPKLDRLVVTSARDDAGECEALAGATFVVNAGVTGTPTVAFRG